MFQASASSSKPCKDIFGSELRTADLLQGRNVPGIFCCTSWAIEVLNCAPAVEVVHLVSSFRWYRRSIGLCVIEKIKRARRQEEKKIKRKKVFFRLLHELIIRTSIECWLLLLRAMFWAPGTLRGVISCFSDAMPHAAFTHADPLCRVLALAWAPISCLLHVAFQKN